MDGDDRSRHVQMDREKEFELAIHKRDEVIQQLSAQLQHLTAHNYSQEATQLAQQVQLLQTQLQHAGKVLQSQTEKQSQTSHALQDATQEIVSLQEVITEKDSMMSQLAERLDQISQEYTKLKESHESTKLREKQTNEVVQKLMMDAEQMRKQKSDVSNSNGMSGSSSPTSPTLMVSEAEVQARMEALRSELEETYGLHFAQMKQAVVQQFQAEKVTLDAEVSQLKVALETATKENAEYQQQLQQYVTTDSDFGQLKEECNLYKSQCDQLKEHIVQIQAQSEDYCQRIKDYELTATGMKELQDECVMYKSQNDELKNKINSQQDSVVSLQSELDNLTSENTQLRDQMNLLSQDLDSQNTEIEEAFLEKSQYIEKAKKLEEEVAVLKSENDEIKSNSSKMEDMISSLKEALDQSETSRQKLETAVQVPKQSEAGIRIDGVTSCESTDETDSVQVIEEPLSGIDHMSIEVQPTLASLPAESGGQSAMCVQEEVTLENASLAYSDQTYNDSSLSVTKSLGASAISVEQNMSTNSPNDSEATLTNESCNLVSNESTQSNSEQIQQYVAQIETLKGNVARLLDEKSFALSEIEKLSDEILVLKDIGNKAEVDLRELDHVKSENQFFQKEREEQLETNLTLMADVQNANLLLENLEKERSQLLVDKEKLEEKSKEITAKYEEVSVINQRLDSELASLRQNQSNSVLSQMDSVNRTDENDSTVQSSHSDIDNASRISTCHSSLDQGQLPEYDSNNLAHFDGSFYFGRQEEVPLQTHEQSTDQSHSNISQATNVNQSANNQSNNNSNARPNKTDKHQDLEQEILQMQTHVDDLHTMRANLQEHIEHLRKEAKSLEESLQQKQDQQPSSESVSREENVTDNTIVNELQERNKTLQEEKDLLDRKVSALEWQVNELKSENKNNNQSDRLPVEEVMVQNVMEVEEAVQSQSPWTKPPTQSLSSQDSIEQEIMVQCSQNPSLLQEVVEDMVLQGTCETTSSRMSPDSIDQEDTDDRINDISSDSIEQDVSGPERRLQERVRNSQCMLSVNPMVPSYSGGAGNSTCSVENALDSASNVKSVGSADSNVDSVEQSKAKIVSEVDLTNSGDYSEGKQGCDSASQILAVLDDTSPGNNSTPEHLVLQQKYTERLGDIDDLNSEIMTLQNSLHELGEDYDTLRAEIDALSSAKEDSQRQISSLQNECDDLHGKIQQMRTENSDLTSKYENLGKLQTELEKEKIVMEVQISELKENVELSEKEKSSMSEVESNLKSELETLKKIIAQESLVPLHVNDDVMIDLKSECSKLNLDVECLRKENTSLKTDNEKLLTELETKEKERTKLAKSLEENKAKFIRNKAKLVKLEKTNTGKSSGDIQQLETLLQNKEQEKQELKEKMENVIIKMVNDNTTLKETLEITMEKLREEKAESEQMKDVVEGIMRTNSELLEQAKNNNTDIDNLKAERSLAENSIQLLEDQRAKYEKELEELTFSLDKERCHVSDLEAQCQDFQIMFEKVKEESSVREEKFATSVQSYQDLIDASKHEEEELKQALGKERTTAGMLGKQCEDIRTDLEKERSNVRILQSQCEDLKTELEMDESKLAKECRKLKTELDKERSNVEKMVKQFQDLNTNLETEKSNVGALETQCKDLQTELETEKSNVGTLETHCKDLQTELETEKSNVETLETHCKDLQAELESEKSNVGTLETQCKDLQTELERENLNVGALETQCKDLRTDLETEKSNVGALETQCKDLQTELETEKLNVGTLETQCKDLQTELETEKSNVGTLETQCKDLQTELETEKSNVGTLETHCKDLETELETEKSNVGTLETHCKDLQTELETEKSNVGTLETQCKDLQTELEREKSNVGTLETHCKDLQTELETEKSNVGILETQCKDLQTELETEKSNVGTLETQCKDLQAELETEKSNVGTLETQCKDLKSELQTEKSNVGTLETQCKDLRSELDTEKSNFKTLETQCKDLQMEFETEKSNVATLETRCKDLESEVEIEGSNLNKYCEELKTELEKEKSNTRILETQIEDLKTESETSRSMLEKQCKDLKTELETERSNAVLLEKQCKDFSAKTSTLQLQLTEQEECCKLVNSEFAEQKEQYRQLKDAIEKEKDTHENEILSLKSLMTQESENYYEREENFAQKFDAVNKELETLRIKDRNYEELQIKHNQVTSILEALHNQVERDAEGHKMEKLVMVHRMEQERKSFQSERQELVSKCEKLQDSLAGVEQNLDSLNLEYQTKFQDFCSDKEELEFEKDLESLRSELEESFNKERTCLQEQYVKLEREKGNAEEQFSKEKQQLEESIQCLKHENTELVDENLTLKSNKQTLIDEKKDLEEKFSKECESLQHYNNELVLKSKTFENESEKKMLEMKEESCFLCGQLEEIQLDLDETVRKHSEEKQSLENQCTELRDEMNVKQNCVDELSVALNLAKSKCEELEKMHLEKNSQSQASFEKLESTNRENEELVEIFKQHVKDLEAEVKVLHQQVQDSDKQNIEKEKNIESFQEEVTDLTESRDFYQAELTSTTEKLRLAGDVRECLNTEIESLKQEVDNLKRNKHDLLSQVESLKNNMTENDSISEDFLSDLKSLTAERDGELTKNKELIHELKLRNERCEKLIIAREQLLKELNASEQLQAMLEKENENIKKGNLTLIQECAALKELELQLKQDLKQRVNNEEKLGEELKGLRQKLNDLEQEKSNISRDQGMLVNENLEDKNQALEQEISHLKENLAQIGEERDNLLNIHEAMAEDLSEMQHKYETVQSLMEDTKKECQKEIEKLQAQLGNVNSDMTAMKSSLELLEEDLNLSHDQKASLVLRLTREESRLQQTNPGSHDDSEDSFKSQKDMRNQRVASGTQRSPADIPVFMDDQQEQVSVSGFFQVEPHTDEDTVAQYEKCIEDLTRELENVKLGNKQHQESYQEEIAKLQRKIEDLEKIKNIDDQSSFDEQTSKLVPQEADIETSSSEVAGLSAQEQEDEIEAIIEERITRRVEGMKYEMEEKVALEIRSKEAEVADKYDKEFKKYKKEMEVYMKHKFETIRAEKDTAFLNAMQKVNKDADKRIKKEVERHRIKLLEERANEAGDGSSDGSGKVGSQIGDVVQKLHQENQDLAEARDALLQQVALSHHNQERLQEELRIMRGDEDSIHSDFPDNIPGESVVSEGGDYIQESDNDINHAKFSRPTYDSTSVMLDWELSPQVSFDYGRDENDSLEFVEHFECRRPRCRLIRQKFQELFDALPGSAGTSVTGDTEEENFNSDDSDSETDSVILQKEAVSKEGSFHPEETRAGFVTVDSMDPKNVSISSEKSGFFLENQKDNLDDNFLHHETEKPRTEIVLTPEAGVGFQPEEGFVNVAGNDVNIGRGARSEFLPEDERIVGGENVEDFIVDDVLESNIVPETMSRETASQMMSIKSGDDQEIIPESLAVCESKPLVDADRFQPEVEFHVESSPRTPGIDITEGFTREADEFENEDMFKAGDGFKPEKDDFSLEQDLVGDIMPITPTSELESELVREALRNAAQMVAPPYVSKTDICKALISEKVESSLAQKLQLVKRSKSAPSTEGFIEESDEVKEDKFIQSADCVTLTALHKDGNPLNESEPLQGSSQQPKQNEMSSNQEHRSPTKTVSTDSKTESETIQRLRKDKKILENKVASLLKEKQNLNDKQREITLQLENETLSRQHLEQELMGISDNFEKLPVSVAAKKTEPEVLAKDLLQSKLDVKSQCKALQGEISSLETTICEKDELLKLERENFDGESKSLLLKIKDLEERLHSEEYNSLKSKTASEQEITELRQRIAALTSVLEQDETKIDLDKQVDSLESQVKELLSDKKKLQHKCKELEGMLRETQMVALKEKTELDKELESIEGRTLMLSSANQDLKSKYVEMSNMQVDLLEEKKQLLGEKQSLESHLNEVLLDNQNLQTTCNDLEGSVQRSKDASITMEDQLKILEDNLCEMTAAKQELYLQCMEQEGRLRAYGRSSEVKGLSREQKGTQTENVVSEETDTALQESTNKIEGLEAQLKEKERHVHKLQKDLEKSLSSSEKQKDFMQVKSGLEQTLREKDNYIRKLEEHFLRQGPLSIPTSGPSMLPVESESEETSSSGDSVAPHVVIESVEEHGLPEAHSTAANIGEDHSERQSDVELKIEDLADHSLVSESDLSHISIGNLSRVSVGDITELSTASAGVQSVPQDKHFGSKSISDKGPKLVAAISHSSPIASPRIISPRAPSTCSNTGSFNSSERLHAGFITEEDGHLESKHSELVDEIARLRKDLSETQAIYTKENVLLKEALDKDGSSREAAKSKSSVSSTSFDSDSSQEVTRLRQKVATLEETNKMLQIENERWLRRIQDQEQVVIELRELLGRDEPNSDQTDSVFGKQITLLQNQRDHLLEKIHDFEMKNQRLTRKLGDNSILEESLRREKDLLYAKLCEKEDLERELSEKRLALEKQRHSQEQLEEILYHKNITEKELMRQKRLLEEELTEIESKLQEKEELLERQKNTLLRDIKRRGSSPPKLLSGSFSVALNDDGSPASSTFYLEGTPSTSTPKKPEATASPRELGRLELQVQEAERQHANAIQTLRQSLGGNPEGQQGDTRQRYRGLLTSLRKEQLHKVPES